jgi:hypothetical protein
VYVREGKGEREREKREREKREREREREKKEKKDLQVGLWVDDCASDSSFSSHFPWFHFGSFFLLSTKRPLPISSSIAVNWLISSLAPTYCISKSKS